MKITSKDYNTSDCTHKCKQAVDIVNIEDDAMDTAKGNIEDKACKSSMVVMTNTTVHPRTMVVHLLTTPGQWRKERRKKRERERGDKRKEWWR